MWFWKDGGRDEAVLRNPDIFAYEDALSDADECQIGMREAEESLAEFSYIEVDEDLYTNVVLSMLSPQDNFATKSFSIALIIIVACLQGVLAFAILSHVNIAMSWTHKSVKKNSMYELYEDLLHEGRLEYIRLEQNDVTALCGDFAYDLEEKGLPGTNWTAYYEYAKVPVNSWRAEEIPPTDRSELDTARFVLENNEFVYVYVIVTFMWILTIINGLRLIFQLMLAIVQMPTAKHPDERVLRQNDEEYQILAFTYMAKVMGLACVFYRIFISSVITWVGCQFLMWTSTNIELILNALALTFILELDRITYKAAISRSRQNLISKLKRLRWHDPIRMERRHMNCSKLFMMFGVLGASSVITYVLRQVQVNAYMDMFTLAAAICLFQGPTPGYWSQFRSTFPAPGLCETALRLQCEAPMVGEGGIPCVENWDQRLCKFYVKTDSLFSTWNAIDWTGQGPCISVSKGVQRRIEDLEFKEDGSTLTILQRACQKMWQRQPVIEFRNKERMNTGPRLRVYPYKVSMPSAPFWCQYRNGSDAVITPGQPLKVSQWQGELANCKGNTLVYSGGRGGGLMESSKGFEDQSNAEGANNMTEQDGPFSGIWLSPKMGVVIIENKGATARVTNSLLPWSPAPAKVTGKTLKLLKDPYLICELKDDGKIHISNGDVLVNQKTEIEKADEKKEKGRGRHPFFNGPFSFWR